MSVPSPAGEADLPALTPRRRRAVLGVVALALMMVVSAVSGLNVALPDLAIDTGASQTQITWIVDAYTLVFAGLLLSVGALGDRFGRKGVLLIGLVVFGSAAGAAMLTTDPTVLIAPPCGDGRGRRGRDAGHLVDHHDVVPAAGARPRRRGLGGGRRRWSGPGPVRLGDPARVLRLELVLRPQRGPGRARADRCGARDPAVPGRPPAAPGPGRRAAVPRRGRVAGLRDHRGLRPRLDGPGHPDRLRRRRREPDRVRAVGAAPRGADARPPAVPRCAASPPAPSR